MVGSLAARWCGPLALAAAVAAQGIPQAVDEAPAVPRSEEAAALARRVVDSLNGFHHSLRRRNAPGAVATYAVSRDDRAAGELRASWSAERDAIAVYYEGDLPSEPASLLQSIAWRSLTLALSSTWTSEGTYGVEAGDQYVLDPVDSDSSRSEQESYHRDRIARDLLSWSHLVRSPGEELREQCVYREGGGTAYLASWRRSWTLEGEPARHLECELRYLQQEGQAFVKRVAARETSGDTATSWRLDLQKVEFRAPGPPVPAEEEARQAGEVVARVRRDHYTVEGRVEAFEAIYDFGFEGQQVGRVHCSWDGRSWDLKTRFEGRAPAALAEEFLQSNRTTLESFAERFAAEWLWQAAFGDFGAAGADYISRSRRTEDGVVLLQNDRTGIRPLESVITLIAPDGHVRSVERRYRNRDSERIEYDQRAAEGTFLKKGAVRTVRDADGHEWSRTYSWVYKRQEGVVFPKRIQSALKWDAEAPGSSGDVLMELVELTFRGVRAPEGQGAGQAEGASR